MLNNFFRLCGIIILFGVSGCSTFKPQPDATDSFMQRKQVKTSGDVSVSIVVPSAAESASVFGVKVAKKKYSPSGWKSIIAAMPSSCFYPF